MKLYLAIVLSLGMYAYAELPNSVKDKPTDDNLTYLDSKVNSVLQEVGQYSKTTSTDL